MAVTITRAVYAYLGAAWTSITADVKAGSERASWGIGSNRPFDRLARTGQFTFSLNNNTGKYLPGGASVISADWKKGTKIKVVFTYAGVDYPRFYGAIDSMKIDAGVVGERKVHVTVLDWLDYAAKYPLDNPAIQEDKTADQALTTIVNAMPIAPLATSFQTGNNTLPYVFSDATLKTRAYSEFNKLALSELGYIYLRHNPETLVFENSTARNNNTTVSTVRIVTSSGFLQMETADYLLQENGDKLLIEGFIDTTARIDNTMLDMDVSYGDNLVNRVSTQVYPARVDTSATLVYNLDSPIFITSGDTKTFNIQFTEENSKRLVAALPPDDTYPTTLIHFDESTPTNPIVEDSGKSWGFQGAEFVQNQKKFGASSLYLDGSDAYADGVTSDDYNFGSGDFTVEWWEYRFNADASEAVINRDMTTYTTYPPFLLGQSDGTNSKIYLTSNGSSWDIANGKTFGAIATNTWVHYALCRSGNTFYAFKNGTLTDSWTSSGIIITTTGSIAIGKYGSNYVTACIDEFRMIKGLAKYTENFTPATEAFTLSGTFFNAYTQSNRGGTELTGDCVLAITYGASGAEVTITNNSDYDGYLTSLKIYAFVVESISAITDVQEDSTSYNAYGFHEETLSQIYKQSVEEGAAEAQVVLSGNKDPQFLVNKVTMNANRSELHTLMFTSLDVGDVVEVLETQTSVNSTYNIQSVEWTVTPSESGGVLVNYGWALKELRKGSTLVAETSAVIQESTTTSQYTYFENFPAIGNRRVYSAWVKFQANAVASSNKVINFFDKDAAGMQVYYSGGLYYIGFGNMSVNSGGYRPGASWTPNWRGNTTLSTNTLYHLAVIYDYSIVTNTPQMYVDGVLQTNTAVLALGTELLTDANRYLFIGAELIGKVGDARIYDVDLLDQSAETLVANLYAAGYNGTTNGQLYQTGLVFKGLSLDPAKYADYIDQQIFFFDGEYVTEDVANRLGYPWNITPRSTF